MPVPVGLDGNPNPIVTAQREAVLLAVVAAIETLGASRAVVGIDGAPGAGKSTFADEIAGRLLERGRSVVRSTTDSFHRPRADRYRLGPTSPEGYYRDSFDLDGIRERLLLPFAAGAHRVLVAAFDEPSDILAPVFAKVGAEPSVLPSSTACSCSGRSCESTSNSPSTSGPTNGATPRGGST